MSYFAGTIGPSVNTPFIFHLQNFFDNFPQIRAQKSAEEQLQSLTRHSTLGFLTNRCALTSKAGGCLHRWRLSRHSWRSLADYNQMSGVQRSAWGTPSRHAAMFAHRAQKNSWFNFDGLRLVAYTDASGAPQKQRFKL